MTSPLILLVEDEVLIRIALAFELERAGYSVETAANGRDALHKMQTLKPDLVITDYMMPLMDGSELIRHIRADGKMSDVPILLVTAIPEENLRGKANGYSGYSPKPINEDNLLALIEKLLGKRGLSR